MVVGGPADCLDLGSLREHVGDCHRCPLGDSRTTLVFGSGDPHAELMFIGEAPGRNEDLTGEPFIGAAGKLLDELLAFIGLEREQVFIANVVKCRPPGNRDPMPVEIAACTPFLARQIELVSPKVISTLGKFATQYMLDTTVGITALRGKLYRVGGRRIVPVLHPAAALYNASNRPLLFDDFTRLKAVLDRGDAGAPLVVTTGSADETVAFGERLGALLAPGDVVGLSGDLGAGKTCFAQGVARGLGIEGPVPSPTFNLLLVHRGTVPMYHFDLYRLERADQLEDIDFHGTLEADGASVVEWADRFPAEMPDDRLDVAMEVTGEADRRITIVPHGDRAIAVAEGLRRSSAGAA